MFALSKIWKFMPRSKVGMTSKICHDLFKLSPPSLHLALVYSRVPRNLPYWISFCGCKRRMWIPLIILSTQSANLPRHGKSIDLWASFNLRVWCRFKIVPLQGSAKKAVPRFGELCCCCCLPLLPGIACSFHATWGPPFSRALYRFLLHLFCCGRSDDICVYDTKRWLQFC